MASIAQRDISFKDWPSIRKAFIEADDKPTYAELAERFRVSLSTIQSTASDEGWVFQRARRIEQVAVQIGATENLIELAKGNREVTATFINLALVGVKRLTRVIESIPEDTKPRAEIGFVQDASFAAANFAKSLREIGVMCVPKELSESLGKGDAGKDFLRGALQQINITVQAAQAGSVPAVPVASADEAPPL